MSSNTVILITLGAGLISGIALSLAARPPIGEAIYVTVSLTAFLLATVGITAAVIESV